MDKNFGGVIWTNHAIQRLKERNIPQGDAWATWKNPDQSRQGSNKNSWVYYKTYGNQKIEVVAKQNERKQWIILSVWSKPSQGGQQEYKGKKPEPFLSFLFKKIFKKKNNP